MSHTRLWASAAIIAGVILVSFAFFVTRTGDVEVESSRLSEEAPVPQVVLRDSFKKGVRTISGSIEAPDACTTVSASSIIVDDAPGTQSVHVAVSTQSDPGVCLQVPTRASFETIISAPADLPITVTVNGSPATTTHL